MRAIFEKDCKLVGWIDDEGYIFNTNMKWIAFIDDISVFRSRDLKWLGGLYRGSFVDKNGRPVAWIDGNTPESTLPLMTPIKPLPPLSPLPPLPPLPPLSPLKPLTPLGGWSPLSWDAWINK